MLASTAAMQGRNAMWHALGGEVATVGLSATDAPDSHVPVQTVTLPFTGNPRAKMAENTDGLREDPRDGGSGTILGGAVVAENASDVVHALSLAVHNRLTVSQVVRAFTVYPSMSGSVAEAARLMGRLAPVT